MTKPAFISIPKQKNYRDRHLLDMARGRMPVATLPGVYDDPATTVAAHGNCQSMGKGKSIKAHDFFVIYVGYHFHQWLDQSNAPREEKDAAFWCAYRLQLEDWKNISFDFFGSNSKDRNSAENAVLAFGEWVTDNKWRFEVGDWQFELVSRFDLLKKDVV